MIKDSLVHVNHILTIEATVDNMRSQNEVTNSFRTSSTDQYFTVPHQI